MKIRCATSWRRSLAWLAFTFYTRNAKKAVSFWFVWVCVVVFSIYQVVLIFPSTRRIFCLLFFLCPDGFQSAHLDILLNDDDEDDDDDVFPLNRCQRRVKWARRFLAVSTEFFYILDSPSIKSQLPASYIHLSERVCYTLVSVNFYSIGLV